MTVPGQATADVSPGPAAAAHARRARGTLPAAVIAAVLATGCGSTVAGAGPSAAAPTQVRLPLAASLTVPGAASWAVVEMGGSSAQHENFWQLIARRTPAARWTLATPQGVADNGGLVAASLGGAALVTGINPSQDLRFSPLATTHDGGAHWSPGLLPAGLASLPSALAAGPGGRLLAITDGGLAEMSAPGGASWARLTSLASLAATPAGRSCGLSSLTAAAFSPSGVPLLAGMCTSRGVTGIFAYSGGRWRPAGLAVPADLAQSRVSVLRLADAGSRTSALLTTAAPGGRVSLVAAWANPAGRWVLSAPLPLNGARVVSTALAATTAATAPTAASATGAAGKDASASGTAKARAATTTTAAPSTASTVGVILSTGLADTIAGPAARWRQLPALPAHAAALVLGPGTQISALAAHGSILTGWLLAAPAGTRNVGWARTQVMKVPVPYGSSS
ncbi:MAG: hypothetical protein ABSA03_13230 [Streptosporangiaceae bacterium]